MGDCFNAMPLGCLNLIVKMPQAFLCALLYNNLDWLLPCGTNVYFIAICNSNVAEKYITTFFIYVKKCIS
ncbi:hypothetical protein XENTR_v10016692 [Xenopus tropicalis]|nr:hypothetical protein XENTR_v10016692 [Xenopus tropicalis]